MTDVVKGKTANRKKLQGSKTGSGADCKQQRGAKANSRVVAKKKKKNKQQDEWATSSRINEQQQRHGSEWE